MGRSEMIAKVVYLSIVTLIISSNTISISRAEIDDSEAETDVDYNGSDCISIRSIRDYTPLDNRTLLIWGGASRPYFVRLNNATHEMRSGIAMKVVSRDDRLCPYGGDGLVFNSYETFPATVRSISRITKDQAEDIMVRYGKKDSGESQTPAPKEVEGAEVEELD